MAGWRTIVINKRCKLESKLGFLIIRTIAEEKIYIKEIETLIIESTAVSFTTALIVDLNEAGANVIICNRKHLPTSVFLPVHSHYTTAKNINEQLSWSEERKAQCWKLIIKEKVRQQSLVLRDLKAEENYLKLQKYEENVVDNDIDNFEARSAAVYFREIFGSSFARNFPCPENEALNYGYTILMSTFAREITACGYLT